MINLKNEKELINKKYEFFYNLYIDLCNEINNFAYNLNDLKKYLSKEDIDDLYEYDLQLIAKSCILTVDNSEWQMAIDNINDTIMRFKRNSIKKGVMN